MKDNKAFVYFRDNPAGIIEKIPDGYRFTYNDEFIKDNVAISRSLPLRREPYESKELFPFFSGLLPEGWYLDIVCSKLKIDKNDKFAILAASCEDTIGAVSIRKGI